MPLHLTPPYGLTDLPVPSNGADELDIKAYYDGLADFISLCDTPMTVAIQGDWGSGKSSTLNFVRERLDEDIAVVEFNTWLYSQFDLGESLVFSLAHEIVQPLSEKSSEGRRLLRFMASLGAGAIKGGINLAGSMTGTAPITSAVVESLQNATYSNEAPNVVAELKRSHSTFAATVQEYLQATGRSRLVIVIDDLDRVEPVRAIEILESLKLFFEVPRCVFVLALDFDVVLRGVKQRYGADFNETKARQYFDKIIQVPFSMPTASFNVNRILIRALERSGLNTGPENAAELSTCLRLVETSVGTNPRSIKRLLNSFELLQLILKSRGETLRSSREPRMAQIVFGLLCAQAAFPIFHNLLIQAANDTEALDSLLTVGHEDVDDEQSEAMIRRFKVSREELPHLNRFRNHLGIAASGQEGELDSTLLAKAISFSTVTSVRSAQSSTETPETPADFSDVISYMEENTTPHSVKLFQELIDQLRLKIGANCPLTMGASTTSSQVILYDGDDLKQIMDLPSRHRPRFAAVGYTRKGLWILFGRPVSGESQPYGSEWYDLANRLETEIPDQDINELHFRTRDNGYPMLIDGIRDHSDATVAADYLAQVYSIVHDNRR